MEKWTEVYSMLTNRNIGLLSEGQQEKLRNTKIAICGLGGLGGPISEMLCRLGIERYNILDNGKFELTNLNRQNFCFTHTNGHYKTDTTENFLKVINPNVQIGKYLEITEENVDSFLHGVDIIVLSVDSVMPCLIVSRAARRLNIPMVEGWALVVGNVRVITNETPSLEEVYNLPTIGRKIGQITPKEERELLMITINKLFEQIPGLEKLYPKTALQRMEEKNEGTTLGPMVWLTCTLMAIEVMKLILNWGKISLAPKFSIYNPLNNTTI